MASNFSHFVPDLLGIFLGVRLSSIRTPKYSTSVLYGMYSPTIVIHHSSSMSKCCWSFAITWSSYCDCDAISTYISRVVLSQEMFGFGISAVSMGYNLDEITARYGSPASRCLP